MPMHTGEMLPFCAPCVSYMVFNIFQIKMNILQVKAEFIDTSYNQVLF